MKNSKDIKKETIQKKAQKIIDRNDHTNTDLKLSYEEYNKLRSVPMEELTKEQQELRLHDFKNRLNIGMKFIQGMMKGYISKEVTDMLPDDDPLKEETETVRIMHNHKNRTDNLPEA